MHRGCLTDAKNSRLLCERNNNTCIICASDGCNDHLSITDPQLACHNCKDNTDCGYGQITNDTIEMCRNAIRVSNM